MGRQKFVKCIVCSKEIRSDKMKSHSCAPVPQCTPVPQSAPVPQSITVPQLKKLKKCNVCNKIFKLEVFDRHAATHEKKDTLEDDGPHSQTGKKKLKILRVRKNGVLYKNLVELYTEPQLDGTTMRRAKLISSTLV